MENKYILLVEDISKSFPGVKALDKVHFDLRKGEVHAVIGENGAGKSTLVKILAGVYKRDEGRIILDGKEIEVFSLKHALDLGISIIFQEFNLVSNLSIAENIFMGREPRNKFGFINFPKLYKDTEYFLKQIGIRKEPQAIVKELRVAEQQAVEIAKSLSFSARIIVMDEPTSALTEFEKNTLFKIIRELKKKKVSIIFISHRIEEVLEIADRVTVLRDGKYIGTLDISEATTDRMVQMMVGRELRDFFPKVKARRGEVILEVKHLTKRDKYEDISFQLHSGEVLGFAGLVGAGRTEVARGIFGIEPPDNGEIYLQSRKVEIKSPLQAIRLRIGLVPEDRRQEGLILTMTVRENISITKLPWMNSYGFVKQTEERKLASDYVEGLRIRTRSYEQIVNNLSGGNQQKVILAKWLAIKSKILILDEPTRGIDVGAKTEIYSLINNLVAEGIGVILISSELPEVMNISDRIIVMREGKITGQCCKGEANQELIMQYAALKS